jgi:phage tail-like protein
MPNPLPAFNFLIQLIDSSSKVAEVLTAVSLASGGGGFTECSGLDASLQVEDYIEGGQNSYTHKFPTRITYPNIILKRGVGFGEDLWNWHFSYVKGKGKRRDGVIFLQNDLHIPIKQWIFKSGLPVKWSGPSLNASQNAIAIESIEIAHEGLELVSPGTIAADVGAAIAAKF